MMLEEIKSGTVSGIIVIQVEKSNESKGLLGSQQNLEEVHIL